MSLKIKTGLLGLAMAIATGIATSANASDIIEMRHPSLRHPETAIVYYTCLKRSEIPAEYEAHHTIPAKAHPAADFGALIVNQMDAGIFLTTQECLDKVEKGISRLGKDPKSFTYTTK